MSNHPETMARNGVSLIGAPTDVGASVRGASMGPEALRVANLERMLRARGRRVTDCGNVVGPANPGHALIDGYRHLPEVEAWNRAVFAAVHGELKGGHLPLLLGGDHSLSIGSISAVARHCRESGRPLRVLWLDAHADFNTSQLTPSGNVHGMPVAVLCGLGPRKLIEIGGSESMLTPSDFVHIGVRSVDEGEKQLIRDVGLKVIDMRLIDEVGMRQAMEMALSGLSPQTHLHVSFDVDFLDPEIAPGVGTAVRGGPNYRESQLCMEMIADTGLLSSLDIVELNPAQDTRNQTAELMVDLIESLFCKSTLIRSAA